LSFAVFNFVLEESHVQRILKWAATGLLAFSCFMPSAARAEDKSEGKSAEPVVVISVAPLDDLVGDIKYLTKAAGKGDFGEVFSLLIVPYTEGLDRTRPIGLVATFEDMEPKVLGFIPVNDLKGLLGVLEEQLGEPEDAGDGVLELTAPNGMTFYLKESNGWAFIGRTARDVSDVSDVKPLEILGDLPASYGIGVRMYLSNLPPEIKQFVIRQLNAGFEQQLKQNLETEDDEQERQLAESIGRGMMKSIQTALNDIDQLTVGWNVDPEAGKTYLECDITALPDTELAKAMSLAYGNSSNFGGLVQDNAALSFQITTRSDAASIEQALSFLGDMRKKAITEISKDSNLPDDTAREFATALLNDLLDVAESTIKSGKADVAGSVVLKPGATNILLGVAVADGYAVEGILDRIIEAAENEPNFPSIERNVAKHGDVHMHRLSTPVPAGEKEARQMFGEKLEVVFGAGKESLYLAVGPGGVDQLKAAIDKSAAVASQTVAPLRLSLALEQVLNFVASVQNEPVLALAAAALKSSNGKDHILVQAQKIERGLRYRVEVEEGILLLGGSAAAMLGGGHIGGGGRIGRVGGPGAR